MGGMPVVICAFRRCNANGFACSFEASTLATRPNAGNSKNDCMALQPPIDRPTAPPVSSLSHPKGPWRNRTWVSRGVLPMSSPQCRRATKLRDVSPGFRFGGTPAAFLCGGAMAKGGVWMGNLGNRCRHLCRPPCQGGCKMMGCPRPLVCPSCPFSWVGGGQKSARG